MKKGSSDQFLIFESAKVKQLSLQAIYIYIYIYMKRKSKRENSRSSSREISSRWIYIALQNVGDIEPQKLSKARLECQGIRSMRWAIEKIPTQTEVMCGGSRVIVVSIKILLFSVEQKRGILRGYCGDNRPRSICQAVGPIQEHLLV